MSDQADMSRAEAEAADWFATLNRRSVTTKALYDFRDWKAVDGNAAAFARVEASSKAVDALASDPDIKAATAEALRRHPLPKPRARWVGLAPVTAAIGLFVVAGGLVWFESVARPTFTTAVGEQRLVVLSDGSRVRLNTDSQVRVQYMPGERRVVLTRGEAFFEAAHDTSRPFVVAADGARVRAVGTKFDVRRDASAVSVTLVQGQVQVRRYGQAAAATLAPNQQLTVTGRGISAPRPADAAEASGWTTGHLTFRGVPLRDAVAEVNRYSHRKIVLDGADRFAAEPVSGVFDIGDTGAFVTAVSMVFDLQASPASQGVIRLVPRTASPPA
jgi:transmembrane sensor